MKTRQFRQLGGLRAADRDRLVAEGLAAIAANVSQIAGEMAKCAEFKSRRASRLLYNIGREEAGKFLALIDVYRSPGSSQATTARQFARAGSHLAKLVYAQMADYSIASRTELISAIDHHRRALYLDGPNDDDWVFRNDLLSQREEALYVDLIDAEGTLEWWPPMDDFGEFIPPASMRLVLALAGTGLVGERGFKALGRAWRDFDPSAESHCGDWSARTRAALMGCAPEKAADENWTAEAAMAADRWPMPLVEIEIELAPVSLEDLQAKRARSEKARMEDYGG